MTPLPSLAAIEATAERIAPYVVPTPVFRWSDPAAQELLGVGELHFKLEFLQRTGTFKARGAANNLLSLSAEERARGVTAISAGNHAVAVSYAAAALGVSAKVVMHKAANPARLAAARSYGAEIVLGADIAEAFELVNRIVKEEGRLLIHPFEGERTVLGTATLGLEIARAVPNLDAVLVAVGGGGLIAGIGAAVKQLQPACEVIGVEPTGAQGLTQSLKAGRPLEKVEVRTIADSMGPPLHLPYSFDICRQVVDRIVLVDDEALCRAIAFAFQRLKLAVEPACVATLAALAGPLKGTLEGKRVLALLCGSNIDAATFCAYLKRGLEPAPSS